MKVQALFIAACCVLFGCGAQDPSGGVRIAGHPMGGEDTPQTTEIGGISAPGADASPTAEPDVQEVDTSEEPEPDVQEVDTSEEPEPDTSVGTEPDTSDEPEPDVQEVDTSEEPEPDVQEVDPCDKCKDWQACIDGKCIAKECWGNDDCLGMNDICVDNFCVVPECFSEWHCAEGQACEDHTCVDKIPCSTTSECPFTHQCIEGFCVMAECGKESDCGGSTPMCKYSKTEPRKCVECVSNGDCLGEPGEFACKGGQCVVVECETNQECTQEAPFCGTYQDVPWTEFPAYCVECLIDSHCKGDLGVEGKCSKEFTCVF